MAEKKTEETKRIELQNILENILGSSNVYFQPGPSITLHYPCIIFNRSSVRTMSADDVIWNCRQSYSVTVIDYDPDSQIPFDLLDNFKCLIRIESNYRSNGMNHTKLQLYY
jgi:hypothetical protein